MSLDRTTDPKTVAVIASYRPDEELVRALSAFLPQVSHVVVTDDGSPPEYEAVLVGLENQGATVLRNGTNAGIASALNAGIEFAERSWAPDYFLTFDQDSTPVANYVASAVSTHRRARETGIEVGFVVASSYSGHPVHLSKPLGEFDQAFDPMQSGFVIPRETFATLGRFAEEFVIDGVDSEFTARACAAGLAVLVGRGCDIQHHLGRRDPARLFGRSVRILGREMSYNYHSPTRVYYMTRNGTVLTRRYLLTSPAWVLRRLIEEAKAQTLRLAFSPERRLIARAMITGFRDAIAGRMGTKPAQAQSRPRQDT